jgi:DNA-binding SARP family transcriptional activator
VLEADANWVQFNSKAEVSLDVAVFEQVFASVNGRPGRELDEQTAQSLHAALELYQGDLLEGWYQDWCLFERERLQNMYLTMLDKQISYCEACHKYELGLVYGTLILHYDRAHERTHRRLMRLQYLAGDRTAALRQFEKCANALEKELGVKPDARTMRLYEQIRGGQYDDSNLRTPPAEQAPTAAAVEAVGSPPEAHALGRLKHLRRLSDRRRVAERTLARARPPACEAVGLQA